MTNPKQDSNIEPPAQDEKPVVTNTKTQKSFARPSEPVTESAQKKKVKTKKPWAKIDGFRSAKFGMKVQEVREANSENWWSQKDQSWIRVL